MNKELHIFSETEWPTDMKSAEAAAAKTGYDTLLIVQKEGVWCLGIENELPSLILIIQYENQYDRKVILWAEDINMIYETYKELYTADWKRKMIMKFRNTYVIQQH